MVTARKDFVTAAITLAAILLFTFTGSAVIPAAVKAIAGMGAGADRALVTALLLNVALIIFGWRRCRDLQSEIRDRKAAEERAWLLASRDQLTGFLNRRSLAAKASGILDRAPSTVVALLLVDLDHFKDVNDLHGHAAGDELLRAAARQIAACVPASAHCGRLGGDEFAILLSGDEAAPDAAVALGEAMLRQMKDPVDIYAHAGASIGIAWYEGEGGLESLLRRADIAMYSAKRNGRNRVACFDGEMEEELRRRNRVEAGIRTGMPAGEFVPYYEPQIDLQSGELLGFEMLARWEHPTEGLLRPGEFIHIAEASGLISDLSSSLIRQALIEARDWGRLTIAVNISPIQLKDPLLAQRIVQLLAETGFPAPRLEVEITESSLFENLDLARATIESLKNQGIRIALDDFGTGYSSLAHLQALPFDSLKVDRSFVSAVRVNPEKTAIVSAITRLGASLGLPVTAEGIEDPDTRALLFALGCSGGQGWLFGKPMPADSVRALLACREADEDAVLPIQPRAETGRARG